MSSGKWIVMVEDDADMHYLYERVFTSLQLNEKLRLFDNAEDALTFLFASGSDTSLIFSDINMPLMDGIEFKKKINEDPALILPSIPFVFLSTSATERDKEKAHGLGIQGFFQKGVTLDDIMKTVQQVVTIWDHSVPADADH